MVNKTLARVTSLIPKTQHHCESNHGLVFQDQLICLPRKNIVLATYQFYFLRYKSTTPYAVLHLIAGMKENCNSVASIALDVNRIAILLSI